MTTNTELQSSNTDFMLFVILVAVAIFAFVQMTRANEKLAEKLEAEASAIAACESQVPGRECAFMAVVVGRGNDG